MTTQRTDPKTNPTTPDTTKPTDDKMNTTKEGSDHKPTHPQEDTDTKHQQKQ